MRKYKNILFLTAFIFILISHFYAADIQCVWTDVEKIVAVGDLHGDYKSFIKILKGTGLIDKELHWIGGKTHLVQIGDVMDRGPDAKKIFDLLMRLEKEAEEAGGKVHALLGNHEEMNIADLVFDREEYVTVEQFVSFLPEKYRAKQEKKFRKKMGNNSPKDTKSDSSLDSDLKPHWENILRDARRSRNKYNNPARRKYRDGFNKKYGKWILEHNAVIKINNIIFVHGGINEYFSKWKLKDINNRLRIELEDQKRAVMNSMPPKIPAHRHKIVYNPSGPLRYRDLAIKDEEDFREYVDKILENLKAQHMVTAHTPVRIKDEEHMKRYDGKIWIIDTNISSVYRRGRLSALIMEEYGKKFSVWFDDKKNEDTLLEYKKRFQEKVLTIYFGIAHFQDSDLIRLIIDNKNFFLGG